jgi:hypothetical protein
MPAAHFMTMFWTHFLSGHLSEYVGIPCTHAVCRPYVLSMVVRAEHGTCSYICAGHGRVTSSSVITHLQLESVWIYYASQAQSVITHLQLESVWIYYIRNSNMRQKSKTHINAIVSDLEKRDVHASLRHRPGSMEGKKETICFSTRLS